MMRDADGTLVPIEQQGQENVTTLPRLGSSVSILVLEHQWPEAA